VCRFVGEGLSGSDLAEMRSEKDSGALFRKSAIAFHHNPSPVTPITSVKTDFRNSGRVR